MIRCLVAFSLMIMSVTVNADSCVGTRYFSKLYSFRVAYNTPDIAQEYRGTVMKEVLKRIDKNLRKALEIRKLNFLARPGLNVEYHSASGSINASQENTADDQIYIWITPSPFHATRSSKNSEEYRMAKTELLEMVSAKLISSFEENDDEAVKVSSILCY